jgi:hypothetical protein
MRSRDGVLPASYLYSLKMQGNEVEAVNTSTIRACLKNTNKVFIVECN